jgi:hypothetical protein
MSLFRKTGVRCDFCGKFTRDRQGHYQRADGSWGVIVQPEWERFPLGDSSNRIRAAVSSGRDICDDCAAKRCLFCGAEEIQVLSSPPAGFFRPYFRCQACGCSFESEEPGESWDSEVSSSDV